MTYTLKISLFFLILFIAFGCKKSTLKARQNPKFYISVSINNFNGYKLYLYKLTPTSKLIDSTIITNNKGVFEGEIQYPERYYIKLDGLNDGKLFIVENDSISILVNHDNLKNALVSGSKLTKELAEYQEKSQNIFSKIELLFPDLQSARMMNDVDKLAEISKKMSAIEQENIEFNFRYILQHSNSFIAAMILNDLSKNGEISTSQILESYQILSDKVKLGVDAKEIESYLGVEN